MLVLQDIYSVHNTKKTNTQKTKNVAQK